MQRSAGGWIIRIGAVSAVTTLGSVGVLAGLAGATPGNLITNGSFEAPVIGASSYTTYAGGSTAITGWTVTGDSVDVVSNTFNGYWTAQDGTQSVDLAGNNPGGLSQVVTTQPGTSYTLTWYSAANGDAPGGTTHQTTVSANGSPLTAVVTTTVTHQINWVAESATFTATSASTTIAFADTTSPGDGNGGPTLDNVSLIADPSPALPEAPGVALVGVAGAGAIGGTLLWRRRRARS